MEDIKIKNTSENNSINIEGLSEKEVKELSKITNRFLKSYSNKSRDLTDKQWLSLELKKELPDMSNGQIEKIYEDIIVTIDEFDKNLEDINKSCDSGIEAKTWFVNKVADASTGMSVIEMGNYLNGIDNSITNANAQMMRTVTTKAGEINRCINLDGFIAEQHAVNTFNMQSKLQGSKYIAEVKVPQPGETYGLNSFDAVIKDTTNGKIVHQYQFKFGKDAQSTISLLKDGNYNNQRFIVPEEQVEIIKQAFPGKTVESYIGGTDKVSIKSSPLTKAEAKELQLEIQDKGVLPRHDWNVYNTKELALNIGKNAGLVGIQAAAITTGFDLVTKAVSREKIDTDESIEIALITGVDSGVKAAMAGALKVGSENGVIKIIPKGTPAGIIANIACLGVENAKILSKVATGELTITESLDRMGRTSTSMVYGLGWGSTGLLVGEIALGWIPIVGPIVGGVVGGMVGYMAGSKLGSAVYSGVKKITSVAKSVAKSAYNGIKSVGKSVCSGLKGVASKIFG